MTSVVTQCPQCRTSFRVTEAQLAVARGAVRCGACLGVFLARRHLMDVAPPPVVPPVFSLVDDDEAVGSELPAPVTRAVPDMAVEAPGEREAADEGWARELLQAFHHEPHTLAAPAPAPAPAPAQVLAPVMSPLDDDEPALGDLDPEQLRRPLSPREDSDDVLLGAEPIHIERARLTAFEDEPVRLDDGDSAGTHWAWSVGAVLAALILVWQVVWFNFDALARQAALRPYFERFCPALGCVVPELPGEYLVKARDLLVRTHPSQSGILVVDAVLVNGALRDQSFPALRLQFSDAQGQVVAERTFLPREYLGGELEGARLMPAGRAVRLSLELVDPGARAVGHALTLYPYREPDS